MKKYYKFGWVLILAVILALFGGVSYYFETQLKTWMRESVRKELHHEANTISEVLTSFEIEYTPEKLDPLIDKINASNHYRVTIVDASGMVLADTKLTLDEVFSIENHKDRPEFLSATGKAPGESVRFSNTLKQNMMYLAVKLKTDDFSGFIRVSHSLAEIDSYTDKLRAIQKKIALVIFIALSFITIFSYNHLQKHNNSQKKKLRKKVKQKTQSLLNIQKFSGMLATCGSVDELAVLLASTTPILFPNSSGALSITHASMDHNEVISHWGDDWKGSEMYAPNECWGFRKGGSYVSTDKSVEVKCKHLNISHKTSSICVPLLTESMAIGALHIVLKKPCTKDIRNRFITIADHLSLALANINLRESLKNQALRDPLTNLYNRRYLDEALKNELLRAERNQQSLAVLMIDVDHFKNFNDSFGHDAGDYTLQMVGKAFMKVVRGEDIACRFGGEEFVIVFPNISNDDLIKRSNEVLQTVRDIELTFQYKSLGSISLSIGVAIYPKHGKTPDELIGNADAALYQAKSNGRNQVVMA